MPKEKKSKEKGIFNDKRVVLVAALLLAFLAWVVVAGFVDPGRSRTLYNVAIDYDTGAETYRAKNLQIVGDTRERYAEVQVTGDGAVTGPLDNTSVTVYVDYSGVDGPGIYEVPLRYDKVTDSTYNISDVSTNSGGHSLATTPKRTATLTFEEVETRQFTVLVTADGITAASGYYRDTPVATPANVTISGPKTEVERIAQVVAQIDTVEERIERRRFTGVPLTLLDAAGEALDPEDMGLTLSAETTDVDIPIYQILSIELTVSFTGLHADVDADWFNERVSLSTEVLQIVGSAAALEQIGNPYEIAQFNVKDLELNWVSDPISITLPDGIYNYDKLQQVTASFDTTGMVEKTFAVEQENIRVVNGPNNATITPVAEQVSVKLLGDAEQMETLLPEDIIIQIDAFGTPATSGQRTLAAGILIPGFDRVFALDSYSLTCDVVVE